MKLKKRNLDSLESDNSIDELDELEPDLDTDDGLGDDFDEADLGLGDDNALAPMEKHKDLLLKLTDFSPYLKSQIMEWLGMYWDDKEGKYVEHDDLKPMMNLQGARWGVNFLRTYTRDNNIITRLDETTYKELMEDIIDVAIMNIGTRAEEFGIKKDGDCLVVWTQLIHAAQLVLIGAGGHKTYSDLLSSSTQRTENVNYNPNQSGQMVGFSDNNNNIQMNKPKKKTGFMQYLKNTMK